MVDKLMLEQRLQVFVSATAPANNSNNKTRKEMVEGMIDRER